MLLTKNDFNEGNDLTNKAYPTINMEDQEMIDQQFKNVEVFSKRRRRVVLSLLGMLFTFFIDENVISPNQLHWSILGTFIFGVATVFFVMLYKCPHCGTVPAGVAYSVASGVSYSKGIHPFPKRCQCCGYYLNKSALKADLQAKQ